MSLLRKFVFGTGQNPTSLLELHTRSMLDGTSVRPPGPSVFRGSSFGLRVRISTTSFIVGMILHRCESSDCVYFVHLHLGRRRIWSGMPSGVPFELSKYLFNKYYVHTHNHMAHNFSVYTLTYGLLLSRTQSSAPCHNSARGDSVYKHIEACKGGGKRKSK